MRLRVDNDKDNVDKLMKSRIIQLVSAIEIGGLGPRKTIAMFEQIFRELVSGELSQLKILKASKDPNLSHLSLRSKLCPKLISQAMPRLKECRLTSSSYWYTPGSDL